MCIRDSVDVVATTVCNIGIAAVEECLGLACIWKTALLFHWECVEFSAHHHRWASAIAVDGDHTRLAYLLRHLETEGAHFRCEQSSGPDLLETELGMAVDIPVDRLQVRIHAGHETGDFRREPVHPLGLHLRTDRGNGQNHRAGETIHSSAGNCLLYTSDAADERSSVDLGGRRI